VLALLRELASAVLWVVAVLLLGMAFFASLTLVVRLWR
jgi:hypothetical protein